MIAFKVLKCEIYNYLNQALHLADKYLLKHGEGAQRQKNNKTVLRG